MENELTNPTPNSSEFVEQTSTSKEDQSSINLSESDDQLIFSITSAGEVTGRHQRGFDGEGSEGT